LVIVSDQKDNLVARVLSEGQHVLCQTSAESRYSIVMIGADVPRIKSNSHALSLNAPA
jgi:hypothetical protein